MTVPFTSYAFPASGSSISRTMPDRYNDIINVKDFGAVGNGITDDTDAIYSALIYSYSLRRTPPNGATIFFPAGTYRINTWLLGLSPVIFLVTTTSGTVGVTNQATFSFVPSALKVGMFVANVAPFPKGTKIKSIAGNTITFNHTVTSNFSVGSEVPIVVVPSGVQQGNVLLVGAGRDASIIRGNFNGYLVQVRDTTGGTYCNGLHNLTIWNESTASNSGAFIDTTNINNWIGYYNCTFIGYVGAQLGWQPFGISIHSCNFYCSNLISTASPTGPPPSPVFPRVGQGNILSGSVGLYFGEGEITNCFAAGFDIGYAVSQFTVAFYGNRASRCNLGINLGLANVPGGPITHQGQVSIFSNIFDRCKIGILELAGVGARFGNLVCGNLLNHVATGLPAGPHSDGVLEPAAISSIGVSAGTAAVTTAQPHGLGRSGLFQVELILSPSSLTPDASGNQVVTVTLTGASTFTYSLRGSGTFSNPGTWNKPNLLGVSGAKYAHVSYFSNILTSRPIGGSFALYSIADGTANDATKNNFICAMQGPYGWAGPNLGNDPNQVAGSSFTYVMCGLPASASLSYSPSYALPNPIAYLKFAALSGNQYEGKEAAIVDGQKKGGGKAAFHDTVSGGGSDHYKVRYDGKNWRRVG